MAKQTLPGIKPHLSEDISGARLVDPPLGLTPVDAKASARLWEDWVQKARDKGQGGFVDELAAADVPLSSFLQAAFELSPYLRDLANKHPDTLAQCHNEGFDAALQDCLAAFDDAGYHAQDEAALSTSLRIAKRKAALICGLADLGGWWSWRQVSQAISDTADHAVQATVRHLLHNAHMSDNLQEVILQHIPQRPRCFVITRPFFHSYGFSYGNLYVIDKLTIPKGFKNSISKTEY